MMNNTFFQCKHFKFADIYFFIDEDTKKTVGILRNVPLIGDTQAEMTSVGSGYLVSLFGECEWMINFNGHLPIYINGMHYLDRSEPYTYINKHKPQHICKKVYNKYVFDLIITDMTNEYSRVEIVMGKMVKETSHSKAIMQVTEWIEREYADFKELEWHIMDKGNMQLYDLNFNDLLNATDSEMQQIV